MAKLPRHHHLWHRASSTSSSRSAAAAVALSRRALQAYASQLQPAPAYTQRAASQQQSDEATAGVDDWEWTPSPSTANDVDHLIASTSAVTLEDLPRAVRLASVPRPRLLWSSSPLSYSSSSSPVPSSASFSTSAPSRVTLQWLDPNPPEIVRTWTRSTTRHPSSSSRPSSPPDRTFPPADFDFAHHNHRSGNSFDLSEADALSAATFAASSSYHGANGGSSGGGGGSHGGGSGSHGGSSSSSSSDGNGYSPGDVPPTLTSTTGQPARAHSPSSSSSFDRHHSQAQAPIPPPILASSPSSARPHTGSIVAEASAAPQPSTSRTITLHHHHNQHDHSFAPLYEFRHGAYGIPKRHPLAAQKKKAAASASSSRGMLAAAADFLTGPVSAEPPPPPRPAEEKQKSASPSPPAHQQQQKLDPDTLRSVQVGEDSYFLRSDSFGIADGVGGWATRPGANPALFSRLLMHFCSVELSRYDEVMQMQGRKERSEGEEELIRAFWEVDPVEVMHRAWERCVRISRREGILGSSTALLAMLRGDELRIANLGDCVLLIVRRGHLLFRSQEQQHSFNFPVQLGMKLKRGEQRGGSVETDRREAEKTPVQVTPASQDEDLDAVEDEGKLLEQRRKSEEETRKASVEARRFEEEERQRERDERRRRAEFEGKDMALFDAELEAGKEFDFDPNSGGATTSSASKGGQREAEDDGEEEGSRSTVYIGFDDSHPGDEPRRDCGRWTIQVQQGDVIILASDGLVDNLFDDDILEEVQRFAPPLDDIEGGGQEDAATTADDEWPPTDFSPQLLSEALCSRAKAVSQDSKAVISPFQQRATEEGLPYVGGKHDDISVLVAVVVGEAEGRLRLKR